MIDFYRAAKAIKNPEELAALFLQLVGINLKRPITRQRFTAAHELCHFFRDTKEQACPITGTKTAKV